jgi:hypothetical protein
MMYEGYFDESGDIETEGVFCISGYYLTSQQAIEMDRRWAEVLTDYDLPYFHMVDCAHGAPPFRHLSKDTRIIVVKRLIKIIKENTLRGFSNAFYAGRMSKSIGGDVYSDAVSTCVTALDTFIRLSGMDSKKTAYFFEAGHKNKGNAYNRVAHHVEKIGASITFAKKEQIRLLQAADLLAWQSTKFLKDRLSQKRQPRKDFLSLMEHRHTFAHLSVDENSEAGLAFEEFPERKQPGSMVRLTIENDGPISFVREGSRDTPIIPVTKVLGWRAAAGGTISMGFKQLDMQKECEISLDQPRLHEAISTLINATSAYAGKKVPVGISPREILISKTENGLLMTSVLPMGGQIGTYLPNDLAKALLRKLRDAMRGN